MILTVTPNPCVDKTLFLNVLTPGKKHVADRYGCVPGGKGSNVSRAVKALGHPTAAMVLVGGPPGEHVVHMIEQDDGVPCHPVWVAGMTRTITTVLETGPHRQTPLFEPGPVVSAAEKDSLIARFRELVRETRVVTFNGTVPDRSLEDLYATLIPLARESGAITVLDSHGPELTAGVRARPYMVKPNLHEAAEWVGYPLNGAAERLRAIQQYHDAGVTLVVLSLGPDGAIVSRDGECLHAIPPRIDEVNAVGSGDALVAGFAIGLLRDDDLETMTRRGIAAGTANALCWDIGHFAPEEVDRLAEQVTLTRLG